MVSLATKRSDSTVAVEIGRHDSQAPPFAVDEPRLFGHIDEPAGVVAKNMVRNSPEESRVTIAVFVSCRGSRAERRLHVIPFEVMADIEVEVAIVVEVGPCRGRWPVAIAPQSGSGGGVFEAARAQVVIEGIRPPAGDEEVGTAVVIVVADGDTVAVAAGELGQPG